MKKRKIQKRKLGKKTDLEDFRKDLVEMMGVSGNLIKERSRLFQGSYGHSGDQFLKTPKEERLKWLKKEGKNTLEDLLYRTKVKGMKKIYKKYIGKENVSKDNMMDALLRKFLGEKTKLDKRNEEEKLIQEGDLQFIFVQMCEVTLPREILEYILKYCKVNGSLLFSLGSTCKGFYLSVLSNWGSLFVKKRNLYDISLLVLKSVKRIILYDKLNKGELEYLFSKVSPNKIKELDLSWLTIDGVKNFIKYAAQWSKKNNQSFKVEKVEFLWKMRTENRWKSLKWGLEDKGESLSKALPYIRKVVNVPDFGLIKKCNLLNELYVNVWSEGNPSKEEFLDNIVGKPLKHVNLYFYYSINNMKKYLKKWIEIPGLVKFEVGKFMGDLSDLKIPQNIEHLGFRGATKSFKLPKIPTNVKSLTLNIIVDEKIVKLRMMKQLRKWDSLNSLLLEMEFSFVSKHETKSIIKLFKKENLTNISLLLKGGYPSIFEVTAKKKIGQLSLRYIKEKKSSFFLSLRKDLEEKKPKGPSLKEVASKCFSKKILKKMDFAEIIIVRTNIWDEKETISNVDSTKTVFALVQQEDELEEKSDDSFYSSLSFLRSPPNNWKFYYFRRV